MNKYGFIHHGARVRWNDPGAADYGEGAKDHLATVYIVYSINGDTRGKATRDDDIVLIYDKDSGTQTEAYPAELVEVVESRQERIGRYVRQADIFLLSCLKYADIRAKKAEKEAKLAKEELKRTLERRKGDKALFVQEQVYKDLKEQIKNLSDEVGSLRKEKDYYMSAYLSLRHPEARKLSEISGEFENTPETLAKFLMFCPSKEPLAMDPDVRVVCEDVNGEIFPITGVWYDKERGMVRLETEMESNEN